MTYDIFGYATTAMSKPSKSTEFCNFLLSQASKEIQKPLFSMPFQAFTAHLSDVVLMYLNN